MSGILLRSHDFIHRIFLSTLKSLKGPFLAFPGMTPEDCVPSCACLDEAVNRDARAAHYSPTLAAQLGTALSVKCREIYP